MSELLQRGRDFHGPWAETINGDRIRVSHHRFSLGQLGDVNGKPVPFTKRLVWNIAVVATRDAVRQSDQPR
jgi:hypothetical protein